MPPKESERKCHADSGDLRGFQTMSAWLEIAWNVFVDRYAIV